MSWAESKRKAISCTVSGIRLVYIVSLAASLVCVATRCLWNALQMPCVRHSILLRLSQGSDGPSSFSNATDNETYMSLGIPRLFTPCKMFDLLGFCKLKINDFLQKSPLPEWSELCGKCAYSVWPLLSWWSLIWCVCCWDSINIKSQILQCGHLCCVLWWKG